MTENDKLAIIGLGYVGLPLAVEFSKHFPVVGFDINRKRVEELSAGKDTTLEVSDDDLIKVLKKQNDREKGFYPTDNAGDLEDANIYIVTVPTPTDKHNRPVLTPLIKASETLAKFLKKGDIVIYESTVYPGVTEEICVPVLEKNSGLTFNKDFFVGYSPERINPGDKKRRVHNIKKITSGSTPDIADKVDALYRKIVTVGTHKAPSIKVAEAAKVIENAQRDINIAFVNELAKIFNLLNIDTMDVLDAAATKWNFIKFTPGLVGGHCIGVDPFYLAQKAQEVGYHPEIILAGRRMNDGMGKYVAAETVKTMIHHDIPVKDARVLVLGITFKENTPDIRNSRVIDVINELRSFKVRVDVYDPWADPGEVRREYGIDLMENPYASAPYDAVVLAVAHREFAGLDYQKLRKDNGIIYDVKSFLPRSLVTRRL